LRLLREQSSDAAKKPEMLEKIIAGKVSKRLAEISLLGQSHLAEEGSPVIKKYLETLGGANKCGVKVDSFVRWTLGQE
jgi:translation elongation factor EF-Ts